MFTGLIREIGKIQEVTAVENGQKIFILAKHLSKNSKLGDSIAVNGVCLTVENIKNETLQFHVISTSLDKTSLSQIQNGSEVNLEPCLSLQEPLGGHLVSGHVNDVGILDEKITQGSTIHLWIRFPKDLSKFFIDEGSVALDGISLTIAELETERLKVSIIPHTWENTNLRSLSIGDRINIEVDLVAKYIANLVAPYLKQQMEHTL